MIEIKISEKLKVKCPQIAIGCIEATVIVESGNEELWNIIHEKCKVIEKEYEPEDILKIKK